MAHYIINLLRLIPIYSDMENLVLRAIRRSRVQRESEQNGSAFVWLTWSDGVVECWSIGIPKEADGFSETTSFLCNPYVFNALYHYSTTPSLHEQLKFG